MQVDSLENNGKLSSKGLNLRAGSLLLAFAAQPYVAQHSDIFVAGDLPALFGCTSAFEQVLTPTRQVSEPDQTGRPQQGCAAADAASWLQQGHTCGHDAASAWEGRAGTSLSWKVALSTDFGIACMVLSQFQNSVIWHNST